MSADKPIKAPKIVVRKCADLTPDPQNPRTPISGHAKESLRRSLDRFGMVDPILTDGPLLVGGHQRLVVWTELGHDTVPTIDVGTSTAIMASVTRTGKRVANCAAHRHSAPSPPWRTRPRAAAAPLSSGTWAAPAHLPS